MKRPQLPWLRTVEGRVLLSVVLIAAGLWGFASLADAVMEQETHELDRRLLLSLREPGDPADPIGPPWVEEVGRDLTALGGMTVVALVSIASCLYLWMRGKRRTVLLVVASIAGGFALSMGLKFGFAVPRPDLVPHGSIVSTASFPSGHSTLAACTYLTLAGLIIRTHSGWRLKVFFLGWAVTLTVLVGVSRVFLGVHWPSDVVGGWTIGATWALLCWTVAHFLQRRGKIEQAPPEPSP